MVLCLSPFEKQAILSLRVPEGNGIFHLGECFCGGLARFLWDVVITGRRRLLNSFWVLRLHFAWSCQLSIVLLIVTTMLNDGIVWDTSL